ncbi:MAG TPA: metalloregulator ArsR/SmtB family transcription factor [Capsulimonadaceae bacterium]|jgi:DNA-binding transcriptional ArsR family regulator
MSDALAAMFKALGDPTRLKIYTFLCDCSGPVAVNDDGDVRPASGPTVGEICCHITGLEQSSSNISFHLKELRTAGLIETERRGKNIVCSVNSAAHATLHAYFVGGQSGRINSGV